VPKIFDVPDLFCEELAVEEKSGRSRESSDFSFLLTSQAEPGTPRSRAAGGQRAEGHQQKETGTLSFLKKGHPEIGLFILLYAKRR